MIINSIFIENYGGLSNFKLDFTKDLNVINEHNGYGKSTINSFIKAMFYGLLNTTKRDIDINEYAHYQPWNGGKYGGSLVFTVGDKTYRIEREFNKDKESDKDYIGTFDLYDNNTNLKSNDYSKKIGFELFGVDESTYMTTVYAGQGKVNSPMGDSLLSKLKDAANEDNNSEDEYSKAIKVLNEKRGEYQKQSGAGIIPELEKKINDNNITIANSADVKAKALQRQREIAALNIDVESYDKQREIYKEEIVKAEKNSVNKSNKEKKENLDKRLEELQKEISSYDDYFANGVPTDEELDGILERITTMESLKGMEFKAGDFESNYEEIHKLMEKNNITKEGIDACRNKLSEIQKDEVEIDSLEMDVKEESEKLYDIEKPNNSVLIVIGVILIIAGIAAAGVLYYLTSSLIALAGLVICLLSVICFVMASSKTKEYEKAKARQEKEVQAREKKLNERKIECEGKRQSLNFFLGDFLKLGESVEGALGKMDFVLNEKNKYNDELKKVENNKSENQAKIDAIDAEILQEIQKYEPYARGGYNYKEIVKVIRDKNNKYAVLNSNISEVKGELEKIPAEDYQVEEGVRSIEELQRLDDEIHNKRLEVMNQINIYKNEIEDYNDILSEAERLAEENKDLEESLKEAKKTFELIKKTIDYIEKAKTNFSSRYINDINKNMKKYIDMIDDKDGLNFRVDSNFKIHNTGGAITRDFKYSSIGIRELVMVALRFALIDTLFTEEYPTIIWDDPFVNLDDDNLQRGMDLLKEISKDKQIIYFTCSKSRT